MVFYNSLAAFRPPAQHHEDLAVLAKTHFENDLTQEDRDTLTSARDTISRSATLGSLVGLGFGVLLAYRVRALRRHWFHEFQAAAKQDRPLRVVFESGKTCKYFGDFFCLPDLMPVSECVCLFILVNRPRMKDTLFADKAPSPVDLPDVTDKVAPSKAGDFAAYTLLSLGGLFLGGETGLITGTALATSRIQKDEARVRRVREAYRLFKIDALRKEADALEKGGAVW